MAPSCTVRPHAYITAINIIITSSGDQRKSLEAYWKIFGGVNDYSVIAANSIDALIQRLRFHR